MAERWSWADPGTGAPDSSDPDDDAVLAAHVEVHEPDWARRRSRSAPALSRTLHGASTAIHAAARAAGRHWQRRLERPGRGNSRARPVADNSCSHDRGNGLRLRSVRARDPAPRGPGERSYIVIRPVANAPRARRRAKELATLARTDQARSRARCPYRRARASSDRARPPADEVERSDGCPRRGARVSAADQPPGSFEESGTRPCARLRAPNASAPASRCALGAGHSPKRAIDDRAPACSGARAPRQHDDSGPIDLVADPAPARTTWWRAHDDAAVAEAWG